MSPVRLQARCYCTAPQHEWTTWAARHLLHAELDRVAQSAGGDLETAVITTGNGVNEEKNKKSEEL